jgi:hypothetical protein
MKKLSLTLIGLYLLFLHGFSQISKRYQDIFQSKPLKLEEINLVTSYYTQNGSHSAVTGGGTAILGTGINTITLPGSEQLNDFSNMLELKLVGYGETGNRHTFLAGMGIDHHTAASQKYISPTGASKAGGTRVYPSLNWTMENIDKGTEVGIGTYYSHEYNYSSIALDGHVGYKNKTGGEFGAKFSAYFDQVSLIYPTDDSTKYKTGTNEITTPLDQLVIKTNASRTSGGSGGGGNYYVVNTESENVPTTSRNTFTASFTYSQVINKSVQLAILLDAVKQDGYLGLPFHRVIFDNHLERIEKLPSSRTKIPIGLRLNYFIGDNVIVRSYYRYYTDDWGLTAHTASIEIPYKITPFLSVSPFYRYYVQTATKYFAPLYQHKVDPVGNPKDAYFTSNYASSAFSSNYMGLGVRSAPPGGINNTYLASLEIRYGHYVQTTDLNSNVISLHFTFK